MTAPRRVGRLKLESRVRPVAGDTVRAKVVSLASHGIHLDHEGLEILVHVTDVDWSDELSAREYAKVGDELEVKILRLTEDGSSAVGWLPWPKWHQKGKKSAARAGRPGSC